MYKESRIRSLLLRIEEAIVLILDQTKQIKSSDDFLKTSHGMFILGGVCMQLIFIGESVKVISSTDPTYLKKYPDMPWNEIMGLP
ncbi:hypothetical protein [Parabacteroides sp. Marseille-P3160]|uniref:hypothetical protein n=1 Tax=Parabacteroides sp. Marseille-P3160 TaxID=1917887 RepID=UPI0009BB09C1|nr:hypothetical protein [Parabacteroides sp. Marseille-P3160]